jgi:hypothetical protein
MRQKVITGIEPDGVTIDLVSIDVEFALFFEATRRPMLRMAYLLTGSKAQAEEAVQDCFVRVPDVNIAMLAGLTQFQEDEYRAFGNDTMRVRGHQSAARRKRTGDAQRVQRVCIDPAAPGSGPTRRTRLDRSDCQRGHPAPSRDRFHLTAFT